MSNINEINDDSKREENHKLYVDERKVIIGLISSNRTELSKNFVTLSTFALGYILYKTVNNENKELLIWSGVLFLLTILSVMVSNILGTQSLEKQDKYNQKYYLQDKDKYSQKVPWQETAVKFIFYFTCGTYFVALILSISALYKSV